MKIQSYTMDAQAQHELLHLRQTQLRSDLTSTDAAAQSELKLDYVESSDASKMLKMESALTRSLIMRMQRDRHSDVEVRRYEGEAESLHVSLQGVVKTEEQNIAITIDLQLSRSFIAMHTLSLSQLHDPLIINLDGSLPQLDDATFTFDIDSDGQSDQISMLHEGNGFLTLDKNGNNRIDSAHELFGTQSGDGFADLGAYDADQNGWIDADDPIFDQLRLWIKNKNETRLVALGEVGIGAIYLGAITAPFDFKNDQGTQYGAMRSVSAVVFESGRSGVIAQVDLAKQPEQAPESETPPMVVRPEVKRSGVTPKGASGTLSEILESTQKEFTKRIEKLKAQYAELKNRLDTANSAVEAMLLRSQMGMIQTQIMALMAAMR